VLIQFQPPHQPVVVALADRESLEQMVVNLLTNALQATAQTKALSGSVSQGSPGVRVELSATGRYGLISIIDRGAGPAPAIANHLFEPFATDKPGGTGLGLVVAKRIAEDHGGSIRWWRRDEQTCFMVELLLVEQGVG
jgi:two-component system C4-dicarboxylate transport sensor histidine kinase DctB